MHADGATEIINNTRARACLETMQYKEYFCPHLSIQSEEEKALCICTEATHTLCLLHHMGQSLALTMKIGTKVEGKGIKETGQWRPGTCTGSDTVKLSRLQGFLLGISLFLALQCPTFAVN